MSILNNHKSSVSALAYSCLKYFIPKYLYNFFLKDNSPIIQGMFVLRLMIQNGLVNTCLVP